MKWFSSVFILCLTLLVSTYCTTPAPPKVEIQIERNYDQKKQEDEDRAQVIENSKKRYKTKECSTDEDCEEICDDIFDRRKDKEDCEELPIAQVQRFEDLYETLKDPDEEGLRDINLEDLEVLMNVSIEPIDDVVKGLSRREVEDVLSWIAEEETVANLFEKEDDDFAILEALLKAIHNDVLPALNRTISDEDRFSFVELALDQENETALEWINDFFEEECDGEDNTDKCVFKTHYCALDIDKDLIDDYFDHGFFTSLLDDILENNRPADDDNPPAWWEEDLEADDLESWQGGENDVCSHGDFS